MPAGFHQNSRLPSVGMTTRPDLLALPIARLDGTPATLGEITEGRAALVVNVASQCGLTPQYAALETMHEKYVHRGFTVVGVPCNQFGGQEPGTADQIAEFCSTSYGVTFPMTEKVDVNGRHRHPIYAELSQLPRFNGEPGDIGWNFEKFLLAADGTPVARFSFKLSPDDPRIIDAVETLLDEGP
jgi:glutathione peroxidase